MARDHRWHQAIVIRFIAVTGACWRGKQPERRRSTWLSASPARLPSADSSPPTRLTPFCTWWYDLGQGRRIEWPDGLMVVLAFAGTVAQAQEAKKAAEGTHRAGLPKSEGRRWRWPRGWHLRHPRGPSRRRLALATAGPTLGPRRRRAHRTSSPTARCSGPASRVVLAVRIYSPPPAQSRKRSKEKPPYVGAAMRCGNRYIFQVMSESKEPWAIKQATLEGPNGEALQVRRLSFKKGRRLGRQRHRGGGAAGGGRLEPQAQPDGRGRPRGPDRGGGPPMKTPSWPRRRPPARHSRRRIRHRRGHRPRRRTGGLPRGLPEGPKGGDQDVALPEGPRGLQDRRAHERFLRQVDLFRRLRGTEGVAEISGYGMFPDEPPSPATRTWCRSGSRAASTSSTGFGRSRTR